MTPRRRHVLVVDDDESFREVLVTFLGEKGFQATGAAGGLEALELVAEQEPSVVLVDLLMPGMSGRQLCEELARSYAPPPALVLLSGDSRGSELVGTLAERYLRKPVDLDVLVGIIEELCARRGEEPSSP